MPPWKARSKKWSPRSFRDLRLVRPDLLAGPGTTMRLDARDAVDAAPVVDLAYLDPPYNQHRYFTNYHVWETLVRWDAPGHYGVACKRLDARDPETRSPFNSRRTMPDALARTIAAVRAEVVAVSFSDEGFVTIDDLVAMMRDRGEEVRVLAFDSRRYIGAKLGVFNPAGVRVGQEGHLRNTEFVVLAGPGDTLERMVDAAGAEHLRAG